MCTGFSRTADETRMCVEEAVETNGFNYIDSVYITLNHGAKLGKPLHDAHDIHGMMREIYIQHTVRMYQR